MPVTWVDFRVVPVDDGVRLMWSTVQETENSYFSAEHSTDGLAFDMLGRMAPGTLILWHPALSVRPLFPGKGLNYYRIRQEDLDGSFSYSPIRVIRIDGNEPDWKVTGPGLTDR
ncbi:MAG: hypothetical protein IPJ06_19530 [Saprospiraceae bacterium]|nr:hypothetical protein [Saprospiraceae bacterium]